MEYVRCLKDQDGHANLIQEMTTQLRNSAENSAANDADEVRLWQEKVDRDTESMEQYQQQIQSIFELSNAVEGLSPACIADNPGAEWRCQFAPTAFAHVRAPVFVIDSSIDSWQVRYLDPTNQRPGC